MTVAEGRCFVTDDEPPVTIRSGEVLDLSAIGGKTLTPANVVVASDNEHGTVTARKAFVDKGQPVTLDVTPDEGYVLDSLTYVTAGGEFTAVDTTLGADGKHTGTFIMPDSNVTVLATFRQVFSVTFAAGEGASAAMDPVAVVSGEEYELPACGFTAPKGKAFRV